MNPKTSLIHSRRVDFFFKFRTLHYLLYIMFKLFVYHPGLRDIHE